MCGIFCGIGFNDVVQDVVKGLSNLEYRGYDSAGVSALDGGVIRTIKKQGRISEIAGQFETLKGNIAISHTRWATHGKPSDVNSHPHSNGRISVVHNGIIENYAPLKNRLLKEGCVFESDTDTEVILHLAEEFWSKGSSLKDLGEYLRSTLSGSYSICLMVSAENKILCLTNFAQLSFSKPVNSNNASKVSYISSDQYAISSVSNGALVYHMLDSEIAIIGGEDVELYRDGRPLEPEYVPCKYEDPALDDGKGFMVKEIYEQPDCAKKNIEHNTNGGILKDLNLPEFDKVYFVSCGTSYYSSVIAKYWFESFAGVDVICDIASEFRYRDIPFNPRTLYVFISQSGETADTLSCLKYTTKSKHDSSRTLALVNVDGSSIARLADFYLPTYAGREVGVASTKNFTCQLLSLLFLSLKMAKSGTQNGVNVKSVLEQVYDVPNVMYDILSCTNTKKKVDTISNMIVNEYSKCIYLGRNIMYGLSLEASLKLEELCYRPISGIAGGELKHGPLAMIDKDTIVIAFDSKYVNHLKFASSINEVATRDGFVVMVTDQDSFDDSFLTIQCRTKGAITSLFAYIPIIQLIACQSATISGYSVDHPRNLAKSVTVE